MRRFLLDTGIAGDFVDRRRGVYDHARHEVAQGNRVGIGIPVFAELVYGLEQSASRDRNSWDGFGYFASIYTTKRVSMVKRDI